jgi:hydroxymethylpyrimidine/phosphomethylpyrimidine kinase
MMLRQASPRHVTRSRSLCRYCCRTVPSQIPTPTAIAPTPTALTIAGSDSGGGAGIQADLKAFARCGVHGTCAITAITAQNTLGVTAIHPIPVDVVLAQVRAVVADIGVGAVKVGMLGTAEVTLAVARALDELPADTPIVVDPVMVAESGARLLQTDAQEALVTEILPRATVLTPNLPEARVLVGGGAGEEGRDGDGGGGRDGDGEDLIRALLALGPRIVVLTGGHRTGGQRAQATDLFLDALSDGQVVEIPGPRHPDGAAHGSGCTHSSVLAAQLALGQAPLQAAMTARAIAGSAVAGGLRDIGAGAGPVDVLGLSRMRTSDSIV